MDHLDTLPTIPQKIHIIWTEGDIFQHSDIPIVKYGVSNLRDLNPDWDFKVYDAKAVDESSSAPRADDWEMMKDANIVTKSDIFRLLVIYHEGGYYQDIDRFATIPFSKVIVNDKIKLFLPMMADVTFTTDALCSSPGNVLMKRAIDLYLCKMREQRAEGLLKWGKLNKDQRHAVATEAMGTFFAAAMEIVYGKPYWGPSEHSKEHDHGRRFAKRLRALLRPTESILTFSENFCNTLITDLPKCEKYLRTKDDLWERVKIQQWDAYDEYN